MLALLLDLAVRDGRIPRNPADRVPLPRDWFAASPDSSPGTQVELLADAAGEDGYVIRLLANTGLRFGELAALRVRRVDFLRKRLMVAESGDGGRPASWSSARPRPTSSAPSLCPPNWSSRLPAGAKASSPTTCS